MKNAISRFMCCFLLMLFSTQFVQAQVTATHFQDIYEQAQKSYYAQDYETALKDFQALLTENPQNPAILYNLGKTYYQKGELGEARLYYEKAKQQLPRYSDLQQNLQKLLMDLKVSDQTPLEGFLQQTFYFWQNFLTIFELQVLILCISVGYIGFLIFRRLKLKSVFGFSGICLLLLQFYFLMGFEFKNNSEKTGSFAIVLKSNSELKSNYLDQSQALLNLAEGERVKIIDTQVFNPENAWFRLELSSGQTGWTLQQNLGII